MPDQLTGQLDDLSHIACAIEQSRGILSDTDDNGEAVCSPITLERAVNFLANHLHSLCDRFPVGAIVPAILPGPGASVDLHWDLPDYEVLVNVPFDPSMPVSFYGDDRAGNGTKGTWEATRET